MSDMQDHLVRHQCEGVVAHRLRTIALEVSVFICNT